jgi:hypothetical protein
LLHRIIPFVLAASTAVACVPAPRAPIDLHRAETKVVRFGLKGPRSTVCPGEPTSTEIVLDAVIDGDDTPTRLVPYRHEIDDWIFDRKQIHLSSPQGTFDAEGVFHPHAEVVASFLTGFVLFSSRPMCLVFAVRFLRWYVC